MTAKDNQQIKFFNNLKRNFVKPVRLKCPTMTTTNGRQTSNTKSTSLISHRRRSSVLLVGAILTVGLSLASICICDTQKLQQTLTGPQTPKPKAEVSAANKEHLLSSLTDSIERQHFKIIPIRAFVQQRPSKFDSGDDYSDKLSATSMIQATRVPGPTGAADDSMRHIMSMHEFANRQQRGSTANQAAASVSADKSNLVTSNWKDIVKRPAKVASSLMQSNKIVSQMLSYISPLVGSKMLSHDQRPTIANSSLRARALNSIASSLNGDVAPAHHLHRPQASNYVTSPPQGTFLARPFGFKESASATGNEPTEPSSFVKTTRKISQTILKFASPSKAEQEPIHEDLMMADSTASTAIAKKPSKSQPAKHSKLDSLETNGSSGGSTHKATAWFAKYHQNNKASSYIQDSFRDLLTLSQLPILSAGPVSTAPSILERGGKGSLRGVNKTGDSLEQQFLDSGQSLRAFDEFLRLVYILSTGVRRKRDPLKALSSEPISLASSASTNQNPFKQRSIKHLIGPVIDQNSSLSVAKKLKSALTAGLPKNAKPRGVMWDMATDPSLAVTVFHLIERASVALPLGFLLMPFVRMIRNPLNGFSGINFDRILPARASHRSVDIEELAKRLDIVDKMLSRALRPTHRESFIGK